MKRCNTTSNSPVPDLSPQHFKALHDESGISESVIIARGYRTVTDSQELRRLGFARNQCIVPTLLLPVHTTDGNNSLYTHRPDAPRCKQNGKKTNPDGSPKLEIIKYELPKDAGIRLDCPPICLPMLGDPSIRLWITEGIKKGDALASRGLCAIDLLGVWNFKGKNEFGATTFLADWDYVALDGREVCIVFDSDVMLKPEVRKALDRLTEHLQRKLAHVIAVYLPFGNGQKVGVDDYLLSHTVDDLEALIQAPRPQPKPAPPIVKLLDSPPPEMRRPLAIINGRSYVAIWPYVEITTTETADIDGNIIKYDQPRIEKTRQMLIFRDDGMTFGPHGFEPMENLGFEVKLPETPQADKLWSSPAITDFRNGERPDPPIVFQRIAEIVDRFIDFDRGLADQRTMSELIACYIMATWFLDAFTVIGFLWPNGERGSGKTQLLNIVAELGYLGVTILAGGSYAALRDLADYGATLCFDDAENLADPKKSDQDKRALLLAVNRKGNTVPIKEQGPDNTWHTRYVNTFCPRCFSAIRLPDPVLASRSIIVPLVRTADPYRANADPLDYTLWPHDRRKLIDDQWALALVHLPKLTSYQTQINQQAKLTGRNLEPWRAVLAVAAWLEDQGVAGLWKRIEKIAIGYQAERQDMESTDLTVLVIRAVCKCLVPGCDVLTFRDVCDVFSSPQKEFLKTAKITDAAKEIAEEQELGFDLESIKGRRIGWILKKLRMTNGREAGSGKHGWMISQVEMQRLVIAYGLYSPEKTSQNVNTSREGEEGAIPDDEKEEGSDREVFEL